MAHQLEQMAYVGETPWHGLGNQLTQNQPIEVWAQQAGMDWRIESSNVSYMAQNERGAQHHHALRRTAGFIPFRHPCAAVSGQPALSGSAAFGNTGILPGLDRTVRL